MLRISVALFINKEIQPLIDTFLQSPKLFIANLFHETKKMKTPNQPCGVGCLKIFVVILMKAKSQSCNYMHHYSLILEVASSRFLHSLAYVS